ncbi:hypothetical protein ACVWY5_000956 [Bradyrhizobium sp. USDA 3256]
MLTFDAAVTGVRHDNAEQQLLQLTGNHQANYRIIAA